MCEKDQAFAPIISQGFQLIWTERGLLLRLVELMNLIVISSWLLNIQNREPCWGAFIGWLAIFFPWFWYDDRQHWMLLFNRCSIYCDLHSRSQLFKEATSVLTFLQSSQLILMKFWYAGTIFWCIELYNFFVVVWLGFFLVATWSIFKGGNKQYSIKLLKKKKTFSICLCSEP